MHELSSLEQIALKAYSSYNFPQGTEFFELYLLVKFANELDGSRELYQ